MWTTEKIKILVESYRKDKTAVEISVLVGKSRHAVIGKAWRLGLSNSLYPRPKYKPVQQVRKEFGMNKIAEIERGPIGEATFGEIAGDFNLCHMPKGTRDGKDFWCGRFPTVSREQPYCVRCYPVVYRPTPGKKLFDEAV